MRLPVRDLTSETADAALTLSFTLDRGAFATAVLRELCDVAAESGAAV
jgi:tRNA pseudouridine13 synthase